MKKISKILILTFISLFIFCFNQQAYCVENNNADGYFQKINCLYEFYATSVKLQDGRVLFRDDKSFILFDPQKNKFKRVAEFLDGRMPGGQPTLLNNSKVLFAGAIVEEPSEKFDRSVKFSSVAEYREYVKMSEEKKAKIYLPIIEKQPELMKEYEKFLKNRELSMQGVLFDPKTKTFSYTGRLNIRGIISCSIKLIDGRVLLAGIENRGGIWIQDVEIYDPKTEKFTAINAPNLYGIGELISLDDGRIFVFDGAGKYSIFNPKNNIFSEAKTLNYSNVGNFVKLNDGRILFFAREAATYKTYEVTEIQNNNVENYYTKMYQSTNTTSIKAYDPTTDTVSTIGSILIPRGEADFFNAKLLKNGKVLIFGGQKDIEHHRMRYDKIISINDTEIFDPNTGESKIITKMNYDRCFDYSILLDDGRLFIYTGHKEMYIPKNYKKIIGVE